MSKPGALLFGADTAGTIRSYRDDARAERR